jgi:excisionase family DNA binding protein
VTIKYLAPQDIADSLGVDVETVRRWIKGGRLRAFKPGKEYRIREADLEEFLREREVRPKGPARSPYEPSFNDVVAEEMSAPVEINAAGGAGAGGGADLLVGIDEHFDAITEGLRRQGFGDMVPDVEGLRDRVHRRVSGVA